MSNWNYGELLNSEPPIHVAASNSTQPIEAQDHCPHCGAESEMFVLASMPPKYPFKCGSYEGYRSELCREREAHNQTKRERDLFKKEVVQLVADSGKLFDIAERAIGGLESKYRVHGTDIKLGIRTELDQLKGGGK